MNKIFSFLFSMLFTGILLVVFAVSIGYATFIENDFGTATAKILVYDSVWFKGILLLFCINLIGSVFVNKLLSKKKWPIFLFHIAFVVIIIGAAFTRYFGFEGSMHIREGQSANYILSEATYVSVKANDGSQTVLDETEVQFSPYTGNSYSKSFNVNGKDIQVKNLQYVPSASETIVVDPMGQPVVAMLAAGRQMQRVDFNLKPGDRKQLQGITIGFETNGEVNDVNLSISNSSLMFSAKDSVTVSGMTQGPPEIIAPGEIVEVNNQKVYSVADISFAVKQFFMKGKTQLVYSPPEQNARPNPDAMLVEVSSGNTAKNLVVYGSKGEPGQPYTTNINGVNVSVSYGAKRIDLPFSIYLEDFQLERYPGSNSPSSYASEVVLKDGNMEKPFRIFMNNILKYQGYRFFQSSYDTDEKGTILSVNHDALGTSVTYLGYLILAIGMVLTLFAKNSRFKTLVRASGKLREERKKLFPVLVLGLLFPVFTSAQTTPPDFELNSEHVSRFESLVVQSYRGRLEPVATQASEILRKVAKKNKWEGLSASEVYLGMVANPETWKNIPIIKVSNPELRSQLGVTNGKYASFNSIVLPREMGGYRLSSLVQAAYAKSSNQRNKFDKEVINVDERVNILMNVFAGNLLSIFPVPGHDNQKWVPVTDVEQLGPENSAFVLQTFSNYLTSVSTHDWATADQLLATLKANQEKYGAKVIPSKSKIKLEVLYQKMNIFSKLSKIFMFTGLILLILQLSTIFNPRIKLSKLKQVAFLFILVLFIAETAGLGIRWYISEHAPWSNGYESMVFVSWATCLAGLIFAKRSEITLSLTTVLAGLTLMVAGMSWMSPELTNLVPVLKSYWLIVHVAIITASYGFLGIGALLGLLNLLLMISRNQKNKRRVNFTIKELVNITQITLLVGLFMLTIGSFIGGVWANESWGRYWGWDPKETWALVTILVYSFVGHMHKIPGFRGHFAVSTGALVAFGSVLMTYFGVNYYLSGLHSYAQGEPAPVPVGVYVAVIVIFMVIFAAFLSERTMKEPKSETDIPEV